MQVQSQCHDAHGHMGFHDKTWAGKRDHLGQAASHPYVVQASLLHWSLCLLCQQVRKCRR